MKRLSLRLYVIILFVVAVLLVTILSTAFGISQASRGIRESLVDRQREAGSGAANDITYLFDSGKLALTSTAALVTASDLRSPRADVIGPILDPLLISRVFSSALLLESTGRVAVARPPSPALANATYGEDPAVKDALTSRAAEVALPSAPDRPYWVTRIPATYGSAKPYFVLGVMNTDLIESVLFSNVDPRAQAVLLNPEGRVITATDPGLVPDIFADWEPLQRIRSGASTLEEAKSPSSDDEVIVTASSLPRYSAQVALMSPKTQIESLQAQLIQSAILTSLGLALSAILLGVFAANTITRPLEDVRKATRRMSEGDLTVRARPRGARELQDLATDFNSMAAHLAEEWEQRVQLQNHLEEIVDQRTKELDQKREEMELFFYGVSHDFKSPVISISNLTQLIEESLEARTLDRSHLRQLANRIRRSSQNLQSLIMELLEFAQAGRTPPKLQPVRVNEVVRGVFDEAKSAAAERKIRLEAPTRGLEFETDPARLRHVLTNLVQNAVKYMPDRKHPRVRVSWERHKSEVVVRVSDNGGGIPESVQAQLFRPFARHAPSGASASGAGLGLSIVKRLTESLGGVVELETGPGKGTTFTLRFPSDGQTNAGGPSS